MENPSIDQRGIGDPNQRKFPVLVRAKRTLEFYAANVGNPPFDPCIRRSPSRGVKRGRAAGPLPEERSDESKRQCATLHILHRFQSRSLDDPLSDIHPARWAVARCTCAIDSKADHSTILCPTFIQQDGPLHAAHVPFALSRSTV